MLKKLVTLLFAATAVFSSAQVFPSGFFPTLPPLIDGYDALAPGSYVSFPMFAGMGSASRIGGVNALLVGNIGGAALTPPNYMFGRGADVAIKVVSPMTYFGGYFRQAPAGITVNFITFVFYDQFSAIIGAQTVVCPLAWTWIGWKTIPKWQRVEIYGAGTLPGYVAMDETRVRP